MNLKTFLLGALCGAVAFAIIDRLYQEHERRSSTRGPPSSTADETVEAQRVELSPTAPPTPIPEPEDPEASDDADASQDVETSDGVGADGNPPARLPEAAMSESPSAAQPDDATWGPYMEQNLRQFLASHRTAPQFDVLSVQCRSGLCEIRAAGFDESTEQVWSQVVYDIRQQPWAEFGETGTSGGRIDGKFVVDAKLRRLARN